MQNFCENIINVAINLEFLFTTFQIPLTFFFKNQNAAWWANISLTWVNQECTCTCAYAYRPYGPYVENKQDKWNNTSSLI